MKPLVFAAALAAALGAAGFAQAQNYPPPAAAALTSAPGAASDALSLTGPDLGAPGMTGCQPAAAPPTGSPGALPASNQPC